MTLMFRMVEFERSAFAAYVQAHPDQWRGVHGLWDLVREASAAGELALAREDILFFGTPHERELSRQQHAGHRRARHQRVGSRAAPSGRRAGR